MKTLELMRLILSVILGIAIGIFFLFKTANAAGNESHWIEAEYANTITSPMQFESDIQASQGGYIYVPNGTGAGGEATFDIAIAYEGEYIIWGRVIAPNGGDNSFFVEVDSGDNMTWHITACTVWTWEYVHELGVSEPLKFYLTAGFHTVKIKQREDGTKLDKLLVVSETGAPTPRLCHN